MNNTNTYRSIFSIVLPMALLFVIFIFSYTSSSENDINVKCCSTNEKQRGAHIFGRMDSTNFQPFIDNNLDWVTLVSWGYQTDYDSPNVSHHNGDSAHIVEHNRHWVENIERARTAGLKVFF